MKYDEDRILSKYEEIVTDAKRMIVSEGKLPSFALLPSEMEMIQEAEKMGYKLHVEYKGEKVRIPIMKMRL